MVSRRLQQMLLVGCVLSSVYGSSSIATTPATKSTENLDVNPLAEEEINNEYFKENEDWWKDPFAMFDDDEDDDETEEEDEVEEDDEVDAEKDSGLPILDAAVLSAPPAENPPSPPPPRFKRQPLVTKKEPELPVQQRQNPLSRGSQADMLKSTAKSLSSSPAPLALLLPTIPKVRAFLGYLPFVKVIASLAVVKTIQPMLERKNDHAPFKKSSEPKFSSRNEDAEQQHDTDPELQENVVRKPEGTTASGWFQRVFFASGDKAEKLPPARELMDQVESLQVEVAALSREKEAVEREYEKASWQLQETRNELANLQSTTQYLKAQLRDNQEVMDRAIRAERRKARDELSKMKEAMLQVLQRERQELRAKLMRQTAEVQAMLKDKDAAAEKSKRS